MKPINLLLFLAAALLMLGCSKKGENEELMNFYLSQPRDPQLVGWWASIDRDQDSTFLNFDTSGWLMHFTSYNGAIDTRVRIKDFWYTRAGIWHTFERRDGFKDHSMEYTAYYQIKNDSLCLGDSLNNIIPRYKKTHPRL